MSAYDPDALHRRDPAFIARVLPLFRFIAHRYLAVRAEGLEHVAPGPAMFVGNHGCGILGPDVFCTLSVLWGRLGPHHPLYALTHDYAMRHLRPLGRLLQRIGSVAASQANAARILSSGGQVLVYPGGVLDAFRASRRRERVVLLPRTGFVRTAAALGVPIIPVVAQGAHRSAWIFSEGEAIARALRLDRWARQPRFPLALALPWGFAPGPFLPYLPLPFPIRLRVLAPVEVDRRLPPEVTARHIEALMQRHLEALARGG